MAVPQSTFERDFSNFELGDNVHELAGGLIPEMAEIAGVDIGNEPNAEVLGQLVGKLGKDRVLRGNEEIDIPIELAADLVDRSGVQKELNRSLWTPHPEFDGMDVVLTGAMANWQDRGAALVIDAVTNYGDSIVHIPVGKRVMDTRTEVKNPNIIDFLERHGEYPTETGYVQSFIEPALKKDGRQVNVTSYDTKSGPEIAEKFVRDNPELFSGDREIAFARVANAGIQLGGEFRQVAQAQHKGFDADPNSPNLYVITDTIAVARTEAEKKNSAEFQSPFTALRQVALTAKMLQIAAPK